MKLLKLAGATSEIWQIWIADSSSTTGAGLTGLLFGTSGLTAYYHRDTDTTATAITLVTMTVGTFTSSGFKEIDATNMPGWYQFCPPNAALASGAKSCAFHLKGATNMAPLPIEVQLTAVNPDSAATFTTGINGVAPPTNWNLTSIDGNGRLDVIKIAGTSQTARDIGASVLLSNGTGTGQVKLASGYVAMTWADIAAPTTSVVLSGTTIAVTQKVDVDTIKTNPVVNGGTITFPTNATVASTTGAVGSVTGAVGSVIGAVGSVTGSVGSVASGGIAAASFAPSAIDAAALATDAVNEIADGFLNRDMSTGTDSGSTTVRTPRQALRVLRNKASITAGTLTVTKEDDSTTSWTAAVTTTAGDPISAIDPAGP